LNPLKKARLTYTSTNEALQELNAAREEASLAHLSDLGLTPQLVEAPPKGKGLYKLQWGNKAKSFMMIGTVSGHDLMIKKEVSLYLNLVPSYADRYFVQADSFIDKLTARDTIHLTFNSADFFTSLFKNAFNQLDTFLRGQPNFKSISRWIPPLDQSDPMTVTIIHPLFKRGDGKAGGGKLSNLVPVGPLKVQAPPIDGSKVGQNVAWDTVEVGSLLCVRVIPLPFSDGPLTITVV
jgi:hypothetical protein